MAVPAHIAQQTISLCRKAAAVALETSGRCGSLLELDASHADEVVVAGDLHGERVNFRRICRRAALAENPRRHLVLQEVCHGGPTYPVGYGCMSHLLLEDIARLMLEFPGRVHFLLGNHEWAEMVEYPIRKGFGLLNFQFWEGINTLYAEAASEVREAYLEFLRSSLLAVRLSNGVFLSHSAPPFTAPCITLEKLRRPLTELDLSSGGEVYHLLWGRDYRTETAERFAQAVDAQVLVHGHEPCPEGYRAPNARQIILDCGHPNGHILCIRLTEPASQEQLLAQVEPLATRRHARNASM